ncbi:MAG: PilZ domain-containing protein [Thermoguttaceae bacterium]
MLAPQIATIVHAVANGKAAARQPEHRRDPRWPYPVTQLVAFHEEDQLPTKEMLQAVQCYDISLGGISFFLSSPPPQEHCTVVLGRAPNWIFVRAKVAHCEATGTASCEWKIGCQFIEKAESMLD